MQHLTHFNLFCHEVAVSASTMKAWKDAQLWRYVPYTYNNVTKKLSF